MSKTVLANVDGFTPVIDTLVDEIGLMSAVVFGRIWRYCQMGDGVCKASLETISEAIGVDRATVMRHAKELCDDGYLKDLTPDLRNRPHVYADTGKAGLSVSISGVAQRNATVAQRNATVAQSYLNKDSKRDFKKQSEGDDDGEIFQALSELLRGGLNSNTPKFVDGWKEDHAPEWILKAIGIAKKNKARSMMYVGEILSRWKEDGYPSSEAESKRKGKANSAADAVTNYGIQQGLL